MRYLLADFAFIHDVCHLPGFADSWQMLALPGLPYPTAILERHLDHEDSRLNAWSLVWLTLPVAFDFFVIDV